MFPVPTEVLLDAGRLLDYVETHGLTEILFTPTICNNTLLTAPSLEILRKKCTKLKTILLNGEVLTTDLARRLVSALPHVDAYNL